MKKLCLLVSVSMVVILGSAAFTWAQEASVFDSVENILIRAFITPGTTSDCTASKVGPPCYSASIEVRDSSGGIIPCKGPTNNPCDKFVVTGVSGTATPDPATMQNPFKIHTNDLTDPDISMSIDNDTGAIYIFCTPTPGLHVMKYNIYLVAPKIAPISPINFGNVNLGNSSTQIVTVSNTGNIALSLSTITTDSSEFTIQNDNCSGNTVAKDGGTCTLQVKFSPTGSTGLRNATLSIPSTAYPDASADVSLSGTGTSPILSLSSSSTVTSSTTDFGNVNVGSPVTQQVAVYNVGTGPLSITSISNPGAPFSQSGCTGGQIQPGGNCTITATFTPTSAVLSSGNFSITSNGGSATVSLTGTGVILGMPNLKAGVGALPGVYNAGMAVNITVSATNIGNAPSGPFKIKAWLSSSAKPGGQLLFTWPNDGSSYPNLDQGQAVSTGSIAVIPGSSCGIHSYCYWIIKVDADDQVTESNEKDNIITHSVDRAR